MMNTVMGLDIFKRFLNDERGAMAWLTICAAVPLTLMLFYMVNSSKAIQERTRTQDAADVVAMAHAAEAARSLNTISLNQVTMTQAFATGVTSGTLYDVGVGHSVLVGLAIARVTKWINDNCKPLKSIPYIGGALFAACAAPPSLLIVELGINLGKTLHMLFKYKPKKAFKVAEKTVNALNAKNKAVIDRFPQAASVAAKQVAQSAKVTDIYFDDSCALGMSASCDASNKRQTMELPIVKNKMNESRYTFCAALHFGTGGFDLGSIVPGLPSIGGSLMNGSYVKRGFPSFHGPMRGGSDSNKHLRDHVNAESKIGKILNKYWKLAKRKAMWGKSLKSYNLQYPFKQKKDDNLFTKWVNMKVTIQCGGLDQVPGLGQILDWFGAITHDVPDMDLYHPIDNSSGTNLVPEFPKILPQIDDFTDHFKPVSFVYRKPNKRWAPNLFKDPTDGFYAYSQALIFNPDEIGLYSQNWQARLIPASKMESLGPIVSRMGTKAPDSFAGLKTSLESVQGEGSWAQLVGR